MPPVPVPVSGIKGNASGPVVLEALDKDFSCLPINVLPRGLDFPSKMELGILISSKLSTGEFAPTSREKAELASKISIQQTSGFLFLEQRKTKGLRGQTLIKSERELIERIKSV